MNGIRHLINLRDLDSNQAKLIIAEAINRKSLRSGWPKGKADEDEPLSDYALALLFEKSSTRTRYSFLMAMHQLAGRAFVVNSSSMHLSHSESLYDTAGVLSQYVDIVMLRSLSNQRIAELAKYSDIPIINGLCSHSHPCQILADIQTFIESRGDISGAKVVWYGSGSNVANSWVEASALFRFNLTCACPENYEPSQEALDFAKSRGFPVVIDRDAISAAKDADLIITDTWHSMGDNEQLRDKRNLDLAPYQVNDEIMAQGQKDAVFTHCMPVYRGQEATASVVDGSQSIMFKAAANRLHAQKAVILWCLSFI